MRPLVVVLGTNFNSFFSIGLPACVLAFSIVDLAEFERRGYSIPNPLNLYRDFQQWKNTYNGVVNIEF